MRSLSPLKVVPLIGTWSELVLAEQVTKQCPSMVSSAVPEQISQINHFLSSCFGNSVLTVIESKLEEKQRMQVICLGHYYMRPKDDKFDCS